MAVIITEACLAKLESNPTGYIRNCLKSNEDINNSLHTLFFCTIASFVWNIARDMIKILLGISIRVDIRTALLKFYVMKNISLNKNTRSLINMIMLVTRSVHHTIYYGEDEVMRNSFLSYEFIKNI